MPRITYKIVLPDGNFCLRISALSYSHAVVVQGAQGWSPLVFCDSLEAAEKRLLDWAAQHVEPAQVVSARVVVPLTERQRQFLTDIGDQTLQMLGTSHLVPLVKRGLLERRAIGMRWWTVRRTEAGRKALEAV